MVAAAFGFLLFLLVPFTMLAWIIHEVPDTAPVKTILACQRLMTSTIQVLCMEYVEGIKISDVAAIEKAGVDRAVLATRTAECYLEQLIRHGFFHCDPHPGTSS